ncbi:NADPH-dependent FMN reductase [Micromonospora auratinigra]|uniref:NAD(P)H-dependent FMN reductase n=1 Tax=Micromonospora auratinigra TaxID=261654 RepID=A0A1A8ZNQ8_9ACTN|nr:NADPH-dependent FMN reductase [Micromonospora auratinigra]SBT45736.1 NAD(P)H-dependent FMN reductase [Micromonospora auratinigra]
MTGAARIVLVSGSTRDGSTNTALLRTMRARAPQGVTAELYGGLVDLPAFVPGGDEQRDHPAVAALREQLAQADAVVFCTPEYAGTLPGSLKNLLDLTVGTGELNSKPVAWVTVAHPGRGDGAQATLATVLGYVDADVIASACVRLPVSRDSVGPDGMVTDPVVVDGIAEVFGQILGHLAARRD